VSSELVAILEKESAAEIERILSDARAQAEGIIEEARRAAAAELDSQRARVEADRRAALARAHSTAQVRAAAQVLQAKDQVMAEVFRRAEEQLRKVQQEKGRYAAALRAMIREAASGLNGRIVVEVHPDDRELAKQAVRDLGLDAEVTTAEDASGGARVATADRRFVVENTLLSRLERVRPVVASEVAALLWGS